MSSFTLLALIVVSALAPCSSVLFVPQKSQASGDWEVALTAVRFADQLMVFWDELHSLDAGGAVATAVANDVATTATIVIGAHSNRYGSRYGLMFGGSRTSRQHFQLLGADLIDSLRDTLNHPTVVAALAPSGATAKPLTFLMLPCFAGAWADTSGSLKTEVMVFKTDMENALKRLALPYPVVVKGSPDIVMPDPAATVRDADTKCVTIPWNDMTPREDRVKVDLLKTMKTRTDNFWDFHRSIEMETIASSSISTRQADIINQYKAFIAALAGSDNLLEKYLNSNVKSGKTLHHDASNWKSYTVDAVSAEIGEFNWNIWHALNCIKTEKMSHWAATPSTAIASHKSCKGSHAANAYECAKYIIQVGSCGTPEKAKATVYTFLVAEKKAAAKKYVETGDTLMREKKVPDKCCCFSVKKDKEKLKVSPVSQFLERGCWGEASAIEDCMARVTGASNSAIVDAFFVVLNPADTGVYSCRDVSPVLTYQPSTNLIVETTTAMVRRQANLKKKQGALSGTGLQVERNNYMNTADIIGQLGFHFVHHDPLATGEEAPTRPVVPTVQDLTPMVDATPTRTETVPTERAPTERAPTERAPTERAPTEGAVVTPARRDRATRPARQGRPRQAVVTPTRTGQATVEQPSL